MSAGTVNPTIKAQYYGVGDFLVVQYTDIPGFGVMPLPSPSSSGECNDAFPAKFLVSESKACTRIIPMGAAPELCKSGTFFDIAYYLTGFQLQTSPNTQISLASAQCVDPVTGGAVSCISVIPKWTATSATCSNVVTTLDYTFTYSVSSGTVTIVSVSVVAGFTNFNLASLSGSVMQSFSISWTPANASPLVKSGNPGYILGKPILFGTLLTVPIQAIAYFPAKANTLTLPQDVLANGVLGCAATPADRARITFGEDLLTGCTLYFSFSDLSTGNCANVRNQAYTALTGGGLGTSKVDLINMVGKFGNSSQIHVNEWISVIEDSVGDNSQPATNPGTCSSVLTALDVQFITAKLGSSSNPQNVIIAARVIKTWGSFSYRCMLPNDCRAVGGILPNRLQKFRVRATVTFIGVNGGVGIVQPFVPPPPRLIPLLPDDIFYPFNLPG
ncbi:UNVERIFIED_CONTAM: Tectonic-3 [Siphonaria sp. JEL0065]|nr:Tectonic-3 [Siphonaria sp. JEL0065]